MSDIDKIRAEYKAELEIAANTGKETKARKLRTELADSLTKGITTDRLDAICTAERDGKCLVLPCKVGDAVYVPTWDASSDCDSKCSIHQPDGAREFDSCDGCELAKMYIYKNQFRIGMVDKIGKTVFLTHEAAEAALTVTL